MSASHVTIFRISVMLNEELTNDRLNMYLGITSGLQVTVYFGSYGQSLKIPPIM